MIMPLDMLLMELIWIIIPFAWWKVKVSYCSYLWIIYELIKPSSMSNIKFLNRLPGSSSTFDMLEYFRVLPPYALAEEACRWRLVGMPDGPDGGRLAKAKVHFWYQDGNLYLQNTLTQNKSYIKSKKLSLTRVIFLSYICDRSSSGWTFWSCSCIIWCGTWPSICSHAS